MAGWNGAGVFTINYTFVQDAANGIKILASKQDTQWATVVGGLMNCVCRDGQNAASGNLNLGGFKYTNAAPGVAATDLATVGQVTTGALTGPQFRKNWLLNGAMQASQRFVATAQTVTAGRKYHTDRWQVGRTANSAVAQQITGIGNSPFQYALRVQRSNADATVTPITLAQSLETVNSYPMQGLAVVLSFWARAGANYSPASGNLNASVFTGTGTDENVIAGYTGSAQPINQNAVLTTSWQRFQYPATLSATATEVGVLFTMTPVGTAGANDYFDITGIQLEVASGATDYDHQPWEVTQQRCKRYYRKTFPYATVPAAGAGAAGALQWVATRAGAVTSFTSSDRFDTVMRVAPTITQFGPTTTTLVRDISAAADCSTISGLVGSDSCLNSGSITGNAATAIGNAFAIHYTADAEIQ